MKFYRFILGAAFFACIALVGYGIGTAVAGGSTRAHDRC